MKYFLVFLISVLSVSLFADDIDIEVKSIMGWLDSSDAKIDAQEALNNGDLRFLALQGFMLYIPGLENEEKKIIERTPLVKKHGYRIIKGTNDALVSEMHARLNKLAWKYAKEYNEYLLSNPQ